MEGIDDAEDAQELTGCEGEIKEESCYHGALIFTQKSMILHQSPHGNNSSQKDEVHGKQNHKNPRIADSRDIDEKNGLVFSANLLTCKYYFAEEYLKDEGNYAIQYQ